MLTYTVLVPSEDGSTFEQHSIQSDSPPTIVDGQGLTFSVGGISQAPSPFPQWSVCIQVQDE